MTQELWPGGPLFKEDADVFRIGADSVLLADFANNTHIRNKKRAADLGCGSGLISVLLALNNPSLHLDGLEIQPKAAQLALENAKNNGLADRITIIEGDIRRHREFLQNAAYDVVVSNPPYTPQSSGKQPKNESLTAARVDEHCTLEDICRAASYLTRWGGAFLLVHKPERLPEIFSTLTANKLEPKRIRFVQHKHTTPPNLVLIESRRGGKPSLKIEAPLILKNENNSDTDEIKTIYRRKGTNL